jgi:thiamine biosynthesis lipoprotein
MRVLGQYVQDIYIRHPLNPQQLIHMGKLSDGAIATSAIYYSKRRSAHNDQSALVVPQTKASTVKNQSYSVLAASCMVADGLTKALAIHQNERAEYFKKHDAIGMIL